MRLERPLGVEEGGRGWWDLGGDIGATCSCQQRRRPAPLLQGRVLMSWGEISGKGVGSSYLRVSPGGSEGPAQASPPFIPLGKVDVMTSGALPPHPAPPPPAGERRWPRVSRGAETLAQRPLPRPLSLGKLHPGWGQRLSDVPGHRRGFRP